MFPIRGISLDLARLTEREDYYRKVIDWASVWGLNAVLVHFTDDQGCAMRFDSHPDLGGRYAFSKAQMRRLVDYAAGKDITLIPEIESFGHTKYIVGHRRYRRLNDGPSEDGYAWFNAILPLARETLKLFADLYREAAEVFHTSPYIHIGCDEVDFGWSPAGKKLLARMPKHAIFGRHIAELAERVRRIGKQPMIWSEHLRKDPRICDFIDRDVVMLDWQYSLPLNHGEIRLLADRGYPVIAGPALAWCEYRLRSPRESLQVTDQYIQLLQKVPARQRLGVLNTIWVPTRHPGGSLWPAIALFAKRLQGKSYRRAAGEFLREFWRLDEPSLAEPLLQTFDLAPKADFMTLLWSNPTELATAVRDYPRWAEAQASLRAALAAFRAVASRVKDNREDFDSYVLSLELQEHGLRRTKTAMQALSASSATAGRLLRELARDDARHLQAIYDDWARYRHSTDPLKTGKAWGKERTQNLSGTITVATAFSRRLPNLWPDLKTALRPKG